MNHNNVCITLSHQRYMRLWTANNGNPSNLLSTFEELRKNSFQPEYWNHDVEDNQKFLIILYSSRKYVNPINNTSTKFTTNWLASIDKILVIIEQKSYSLGEIVRVSKTGGRVSRNSHSHQFWHWHWPSAVQGPD